LIKGTEGIVVRFAKCCRPIPGDPIGGFIESGHGLVVHIESCPALDKFRHNHDHYVSLHWEPKIHTDFPVDLGVDIFNQRGSLAGLALAISEADSNIANIKAEEFDERDFSVHLTITVRDRIHLARVLRKIRKNKSVIRVIRLKPQLKKKKKSA
jgi:guanosine-3',5'-bis(diphosphate) 3'-pyrophosphohydrolase